ncbi:luciferin 4-monooxygenase-like [Pectinophora gossypiella]|uniref:luciferin 4-monooxygenase-like n=1 Tax=Pectinophora gossypiella TaxID=13191 RepID=UPI00214F3AC0|nr:luciferin 4-monooxygenase-like [Pectinophora gossypiella]
MHHLKRETEAGHWYINELGARVVAESGRPEDRFHLGKLLLTSLRDDPDLISQIDGGTGESETCGSVLERSVRCANAFRKLGLGCGDVIVLMAPNYLDIAIPCYAGLYTGVAAAPIDKFMEMKDLKHMLDKDKPKIVFCQSKRAKDVREALDSCNLASSIVIFDEDGDKVNNTIYFKDFLTKYNDETTVENFKATDFNPEDATAVLISTSGSTGLPKQNIITHKNVVISASSWWPLENKFPAPTRIHLVVSPLQWLTAMIQCHLSVLFKYTRLQSSHDMDYAHVCHLINTYRPTSTINSPVFLANLLRYGAQKCDFTSFQTVYVGGSAVSPDLIDEFKSLAPKANIWDIYGTTEISGLGFVPNATPLARGPNACQGKQARHLEYRLIDIDNNEDIVEPNVRGELLLKGPSVFKGYYKNEEETKLMMTEDGWYKTGDIFYRDEHWNFYFVARIKFLLKYKTYRMSPVEIENVINQHPGVQYVVVTGIPDTYCGDLLAACVVRRPGSTVTAQEIKDLVINKLPDSRQLRGGVVFVDKMPLTATTKVNLMKVKELVINAERE